MKLSPRLADFAAAYLSALHARGKNPTAPKINPAPDLCSGQIMQIMRNTAQLSEEEKTPEMLTHSTIAHFPCSIEKQQALNIVKWTYAAAKLPADSPRFAYYVSRWNVPEKIERAITAGTFDEITADCPPIDPSWIRFVPAALEEWRAFQRAHARPITETRQCSPKLRRVV